MSQLKTSSTMISVWKGGMKQCMYLNEILGENNEYKVVPNKQIETMENEKKQTTMQSQNTYNQRVTNAAHTYYPLIIVNQMFRSSMSIERSFYLIIGSVHVT
jgi:hypothetical protein